MMMMIMMFVFPSKDDHCFMYQWVLQVQRWLKSPILVQNSLSQCRHGITTGGPGRDDKNYLPLESQIFVDLLFSINVQL